jgi:hypothetical protein
MFPSKMLMHEGQSGSENGRKVPLSRRYRKQLQERMGVHDDLPPN